MPCAVVETREDTCVAPLPSAQGQARLRLPWPCERPDTRAARQRVDADDRDWRPRADGPREFRRLWRGRRYDVEFVVRRRE